MRGVRKYAVAAMDARRVEHGQPHPGLFRIVRFGRKLETGRNSDNRLNERIPEFATAGRENPPEVLATDQDAACRLDPREVVDVVVDEGKHAAPHARVERLGHRCCSHRLPFQVGSNKAHTESSDQ